LKFRWTLIALNLLALVGLAFLYPQLMISPGALTPAHAHLATTCFDCHSPLRGADGARCVQCHSVRDIGLRTTLGSPIKRATVKSSFHQALITQDCLACHGEHQMAQRGHKPFSHSLLRAEIRGGCQDCHRAPDNDLHRQIATGCGQCHGDRAWKPANFEHDKLFRLDSDHRVSCATCHIKGNYQRYTCYGCHEHSKTKVLAQHREEGISDIDNCVRCHRDARADASESEADAGRERD
jgi:hypothetical protein